MSNLNLYFLLLKPIIKKVFVFLVRLVKFTNKVIANGFTIIHLDELSSNYS